jgi:hypothetical protein
MEGPSFFAGPLLALLPAFFLNLDRMACLLKLDAKPKVTKKVYFFNNQLLDCILSPNPSTKVIPI